MKVSWERVRFDPRCKICNLYQLNKDLFHKLHEMIIDLGFSQSKALRYVNGEIEKLNSKNPNNKAISFLNNMNTSKHFRRHLPIDLAAIRKVNRSVRYPVCIARNEDAEQALKNIADRATSSYMTGYEEYSAILANFKKRVKEVDNLVNSVGLDLSHARDYAALIHELRSMQSEQIKLNNSESYISMIVGQILEDYTRGSLLRVRDVLDKAKEDIGQRVNDVYANKAVTDIQSAFIDGLGESAKIAINSARKQFKVRI